MSKLTPMQKAKRIKRIRNIEQQLNRKKREVKALDKFYKRRVQVATNKIIQINKRKLKKG